MIRIKKYMPGSVWLLVILTAFWLGLRLMVPMENILFAKVYILINFILLGLSYSGLLFISIHFIVKAKWSEPLLPLAYKTTTGLPVFSISFLISILFYETLFSTYGLIYFKPLFLGFRLIAILLVWNILRFRFKNILEHKRKQSEKKESTLFITIYLISMFLLAWDWIITPFDLQHNPLFIFMLMVLFMIITISLIVLLYVRSGNFLSGVSQDLGRYLLLFLFLWVYFILSESIIQWYADLNTNNLLLQSGSILKSQFPPFIIASGGILLLLNKKNRKSGKRLLYISLLLLVAVCYYLTLRMFY